MGFYDWLKDKFTPDKEEETVTVTTTPPKTLDPVRSIDYEGGGGVTISGTDVWTGGGGSSSTSTAPVTVISTDFTPEETEQKVEDLGFTNIIQPSSVSTLQPSTGINPYASSVMTAGDSTSLATRPYSLGDDTTATDRFKLRFKKYTQPEFYKSIVATSFGAGKYSVSNFPNPVLALGMLWPSVPEKFRGRKGDTREADRPFRGTGVLKPDGTYGVPDQYKGKTEFEKIREKEIIAKGIETGRSKEVETELLPAYKGQIQTRADLYQSQIDAGKITLPQAETSLAKDVEGFRKRYSLEAQYSFETKLKDDPLYQLNKDWRKDFNKATQFKSDFSTFAVTGVLIAGSFVAPVATGAIIATSGFGSGYEGISEKDYVKAGIGFGAGALGVYGASRGLASQITKLQIEDVLATKPKYISSTRVGSGKTFTDFYTSTQYTGNAYAYTKGSVVTQLGKGNTFKILGGKTDTIVLTRDYWTGQTLVAGGGQKVLTSGGRFYPSLSKGGFIPSKFDLTLAPKYSYSALISKSGDLSLKGSVYQGYSRISTSPYGGISKASGDRILSFSGKVSGYPVDYVKGSGFFQVRNIGYNVDVDTIGLAKVIDPSKLSKSIYFDPYPASGLGATFPSGGGGTVSYGNMLAKTVQSFQAPVITPAVSGSQIYGSASTIINKISGGTGGLLTLPVQDTFSIQEPKTSSVLFSAPALKSMSKTDIIPASSASAYASASYSYQGIAQIPAVATIPALKSPQILKSISKLGSPLISAPALTPNIKFPFRTKGFPFVLPRLPSFDSRGLGKRRIKVKKIVKYTPSFGALIFGIRGAKPKGVETGLRIRPITKGTQDMFKFFRRYTQPKRKRIIKKRKLKRR